MIGQVHHQKQLSIIPSEQRPNGASKVTSQQRRGAHEKSRDYADGESTSRMETDSEFQTQSRQTSKSHSFLENFASNDGKNFQSVKRGEVARAVGGVGPGNNNFMINMMEDDDDED